MTHRNVYRPPRRAPSKRFTPTLVIGLVALVGSTTYLRFAVTMRSKDQVPLLVSGAVVLGLVFAVLAAAGGIGAYRTAVEGRSWSALASALGGGIAAIAAFGLFAFAIVLALVWRI